MASVDRKNVVDAIESLFNADTTILYGDAKFINTITTNYTDFINARVTAKTSYKMFLKANSVQLIESRAQNADYTVNVVYRVEGYMVNPQTAQDHLDDIDERIRYLIENEMHGGTYLSSHFTNSETTVIDMEWLGSDSDVVMEDKEMRVHCEGNITVSLNRVKL